jgi:hypothetical protein
MAVQQQWPTTSSSAPVTKRRAVCCMLRTCGRASSLGLLLRLRCQLGCLPLQATGLGVEGLALALKHCATHRLQARGRHKYATEPHVQQENVTPQSRLHFPHRLALRMVNLAGVRGAQHRTYRVFGDDRLAEAAPTVLTLHHGLIVFHNGLHGSCDRKAKRHTLNKRGKNVKVDHANP